MRKYLYGGYEELIEEKNKEIERLNNIINELEKELKDDYKIWMCNSRSNGKSVKFGIDVCKMHFYNRLQELKGSNEPSFEEMVGFVENVYKDIKSQSTLHEELEEERKTIAKIVGDFKEINK